jgi:MFS family permease
MAAARVLVGVGEATLTPAAISMLSDVFRPRLRALASGVYYLGIPIGVALSLLLSATLGPLLGGWRECFYLLGGLGIPLAFVTWFLADPRRGGMEETAATASVVTARPSFSDIANCLWRSPALMLTILGGVAMHFAMGAGFFDVIWLRREHGYSQRDAGIFLGAMFFVGGVTGNVLGGWLADRFRRRWQYGRLLFLACGQLLLYPIALNFRWLPADSPWFAVTCVVGAVLMTYFYGSLFATVQDLAPVSVRSTMIAVLIFSVNLLGIAPGSFFAGRLCDSLDGRVEYPMSWGLFVTGLAGLLAVPCFLIAAKRYAIDAARIADDGRA